MSLKSAAFFALIGMTLLTVMLAVVFIRDVSALLAGAIAAITVLISFIHLLGQPQCRRVPVRVLQSAVVNPQSAG